MIDSLLRYVQGYSYDLEIDLRNALTGLVSHLQLHFHSE